MDRVFIWEIFSVMTNEQCLCSLIDVTEAFVSFSSSFGLKVLAQSTCFQFFNDENYYHFALPMPGPPQRIVIVKTTIKTKPSCSKEQENFWLAFH